MEKKRKMLELRERLDKTLASPDLANGESIESLVKDQLLRSSFGGNEGELGNVVARRTKEVFNFLEMLRSASGNDKEASKENGVLQRDWKVKQDTEQLRVMYREGPHGTPFHTLLAEGYADGPIDVCLCVSWESILYKKWWPQYNIPTFKIIMSTCLKKVRIGEDISLVRMKVPWPISDREALLHYFEIEYFKEDLILVLVNTISDIDHIDAGTHGFSRDGIPEAKDTIRVDLVGGFVLQKISAHKSYFRAIANMDIKLDFVPPSLINFVSRQIIGNGHKLYQKAVGSVATSDEEYREALKGPMYVRIREGLDSCNKHKTTLVGLEENKHAGVSLEEEKHAGLITAEHTTEDYHEALKGPMYGRIREGLDSCNKHKTALVGLEENKHAGVLSLEEEKHAGLITAEHTIETAVVNQPAIHNTSVPEIIEEDTEHSPCKEGNLPMDFTSTDAITDQEHIIKGRACISPEVEHALGILERAIAIARGGGFCDIRSNCSLVDQESPTSERIAEAGSVNDETPNSNMDKLSNKAEAWTPEDFRCNGVDSASGEAHDDMPLPTEWLSASGNAQETNLNCSPHGRLIGAAVTPVLPPILDSGKVCDEQSLKANGFHESGPHSGMNKQNRKKKHRLCCLTLGLIRG